MTDKLNWSGHIENFKNKILPLLGALYRLGIKLLSSADL